MKRCLKCGAPMERKKGESHTYFADRKFCNRSCYAGYYNMKPIWQTFQEKTEAQESGCIHWNGYRDKKGYGRFSSRSGEVLAHRLAYIMHNGPIEDGLHVLHRCDNPACCNPHHLFLGTNQDNMDDMKRKGRASVLLGRTNPNYRHGRNCRASPCAYEIREHRNG